MDNHDSVEEFIDQIPEPEVAITEQPTAAKSFADIFEDARKGLSSFIYSNKGLVVNGKSLAQWSAYYSIDIPDNCDMATTVSLLSKVNSLLSNLNHNLEISDISQKMIQVQHSQQKATLHMKYKNQKGSAIKWTNESISAQCDIDMYDENVQLILAEFIVSFFEGRRNYLTSARKTLESIMWGRTSEMKLNSFTAHNDD
jgi:hypothetical protein